MTDNPSSGPSKGPTPGEEIIEKWIYSLPVGMRKNIAAEVDSALASQEARRQQEMEREKTSWERLYVSTEREIGLLRERAKKAEQELAEAKRERDKARESAAARLRHIEMRTKAESSRSLIQQRAVLATKLREAEARAEDAEIELTNIANGSLAHRALVAEAREKVLREAIVSAASAVQACITDHARRCAVDVCHDHRMFRDLTVAVGIMDAALAALRSGPAPQEQGLNPPDPPQRDHGAAVGEEKPPQTRQEDV